MDDDFDQDGLDAQLRNRTMQYDFMSRMDLLLPKFKSAICTSSFLASAFSGDLYLPLQKDCPVIQRVTFPPKESVRRELLAALKNMEHKRGVPLLGEHLASHESDKQFLLLLLRHVSADHAFWHKNYEPPRKPKPEVERKDEIPQIFNKYAAALSGMPKLAGKNKGNRRSHLPATADAQQKRAKKEKPQQPAHQPGNQSEDDRQQLLRQRQEIEAQNQALAAQREAIEAQNRAQQEAMEAQNRAQQEAVE
jgi:hypothetical protein